MMGTIKGPVFLLILFVVLPCRRRWRSRSRAPAAGPPPRRPLLRRCRPPRRRSRAAAARRRPRRRPRRKKKGVAPGCRWRRTRRRSAAASTSPAEPPPVVAPEPSAEWKFEVTGYFRAPMRMSWGPATTQDTQHEAATSIRARSCARRRWCPTRTTSTGATPTASSAPWTELNFNYGNDRVKAQVQIASYNLTDPGYRRLESNLGINQAFLQLLWPELAGNENLHLIADRRRLHQPLRRGGPLRRRQIRDLPVRPHARRGRDGQRRLRRRATTDPRRSKPAAARSWSRSRSTARRAQRQRLATQLADVGAVPGPAAAGVGVRAARAPGRRVQEAADHRRALHRRVRERQRALDGVHGVDVQHSLPGASGRMVVRPRQQRPAACRAS